MNSAKIRVLLAEDDLDFQLLTADEINAQEDMCLIYAASTREDAFRAARALTPDIVLMDLNLTGSYLDGIETSRDIRLATDTKVIILTSFENPEITLDACKRAFASGYVYKSQFSILVETIRKTAKGYTPQEHMINSLILADLSPAEQSVFYTLLGKELHLRSSPKTIANQKKAILHKFGLQSQQQLLHLFHDKL